jgi:hypothetical protein
MPTLVETRTVLHAVAERVLAAARFRAEGHIGLVVTPYGIATPPFGPDGTVIALTGTELVVAGDRHPLTTLTELAALTGGPPEAPTSYAAATHLDPDAPLEVDVEDADRLMSWFSLGDSALRELVPDAEPVLWPEHFDVAIRPGLVNYGASPGDELLDAPYLYVGPDHRPLPYDSFWNAPFGAARTWDEIDDLDTALAFLRDGAARVALLGA